MRRARDVVVMVFMAGLTAWAALLASRLEIDVENSSMKSTGTPQAKVAARAAAEFGEDRTVVLLLEPRQPAAEDPVFDEDVAHWLDGLRTSAGARPLPAPRAGTALVTVDVPVRVDGRYADEVRRIVEQARSSAPATHRVLVTGFPAGEVAIAEALAAERARIVPWIGGVAFVLLLAFYRSLALAIGAMLPALAGIAWASALQWGLGLPVDPVSSLLPPVLLTVGVAGSVHLLEKFVSHRAAGDSSEVASRAAIRDLLVPASLTVTTTVVGFVGLLASPIPAVRRFGLLAAAGVVLTCGITFVTLPPWLRCFANGAGLRRRGEGPWSLLGAGLATLLRRRARVVVGACAVVTISLAWCWTQLSVDTDPLRVLPASHPFRVATQRVADTLGGSDTFDLLVEPPLPSAAPARIAALTARLLSVEGVVAPAGPPRRSGDSYLLPLLLAPAGTTARETTFAVAESAAHEVGFERATATGPAVMVARDSGALVRGQSAGLAFTLALLWIAMCVGFRSTRLGTLGLIPNVLPCVLLYGALGAVGRPLSVGTAMIGSVMLGLVVDDTIHFLHSYRLSRAAGSGRTTSLARAFRRSGRAIVVTTLVLAAGFGTAALGELETTREFGILASGTVVAALLADLILLPAVVLLTARAPATVTVP